MFCVLDYIDSRLALKLTIFVDTGLDFSKIVFSIAHSKAIIGLINSLRFYFQIADIFYQAERLSIYTDMKDD